MLPRTLLPIIVASLFTVHTSSQYVDFLQGLQTFLQPYQIDGSVTRKPERPRHGSRHQNPVNPVIVFPSEDRSDRTRTQTTSRKTTRPTPSHTPTSRPKAVSLETSKHTTASKASKPKSNENRKTDYGLFNNDNIFFPEDITPGPVRKTQQWGSKSDNRNPTTTAPLGKNRNPQLSSVSAQKNTRNPEVSSVSSQWGGRNPQPSSTQTKNTRNPEVSAISTPLGNKNVQTPPSSLTQWNRNDKRNPAVTPQWNANKPASWANDRPLPPGVKPAPVDESRPPITNKPLGPVYPTANPEEPEIEVGPDEDDMSALEKRQYLAAADEMCTKYKALSVRKVVALPLVPSPEAVEFNVSDCAAFNIPLIIGGKVSTIEEFPHMSLVGWKKVEGPGYSWKCGGSLISDQYVLTAGHCTYHEKDYNVVSGPPHAVQLGSTYVNGQGAVVKKTASVIRHPKYKLRRSYYDIALIKLASKVSFSDVIRPACLGVPPPVGQPIIATGWGRTEFGGDQSLELRSVSLPIWDMQECKDIWGTSLKLPNGPSSDSHVCAGERAGGKDTCQGDSGGPAQVRDDCVWRVVAVTSSGRSCGAPDTPALYATIPRAFVAAQVFGKTTSRFDNQINSNQNPNRDYYSVQNTPNRNNNNQGNNNLNQNQYLNNQQSINNNLNAQNGNADQYFTNNYNQNGRVTTPKPSRVYNQATRSQNANNQNFNTNSQNQNYNVNTQTQNSFSQNRNYNQNVPNSNNFNQNYHPTVQKQNSFNSNLNYNPSVQTQNSYNPNQNYNPSVQTQNSFNSNLNHNPSVQTQNSFNSNLNHNPSVQTQNSYNPNQNYNPSVQTQNSFNQNQNRNSNNQNNYSNNQNQYYNRDGYESDSRSQVYRPEMVYDYDSGSEEYASDRPWWNRQ